MFFDVVEGVLHHPSVTSRVFGGTVHQVLFAEADEFAFLDGVGSLQCASLELNKMATLHENLRISPVVSGPLYYCEIGNTHGTEGPAGTALSLILDRGDDTLGHPINGGWGLQTGLYVVDGGLLTGWFQSSAVVQHGLEFFSC